MLVALVLSFGTVASAVGRFSTEGKMHNDDWMREPLRMFEAAFEKKNIYDLFGMISASQTVCANFDSDDRQKIRALETTRDFIWMLASAGDDCEDSTIREVLLSLRGIAKEEKLPRIAKVVDDFVRQYRAKCQK